MFKNESGFEKIINRLNIDTKPSPAHRENLRRQMLSAFNETNIGPWQKFGRTIMKSPIAKLAAAAVIIVGLTLSVNLFTKSILTTSPIIPTASAAEVLAEAAQAVCNLRSVHIKARMRTDPYDNFASINLDRRLVSLELWKQVDDNNVTRWRYEKPGRVMVTEGEDWDNSVLLIRGEHACKWKGPGGSVGDLKRLLDVDKVLDSEIQRAEDRSSRFTLTNEKGFFGRNKLVLTIDANAQGDFTNDWCKNKYITNSDNRRIYTFDPKTKLLERLKIYIYPSEKQKVLAFEIRQIEYNIDIDPKLFTLKVPKDAIWYEEPKDLGEKYQQMGSKEVAQAFFEAFANKNWDEVVKFWTVSAVSEDTKRYYGELEIIRIGEPFKSGLYPGWFVPYEIRLKNGTIQKHNLAVRNDNPAKRYVVDGGF